MADRSRRRGSLIGDEPDPRGPGVNIDRLEPDTQATPALRWRETMRRRVGVIAVSVGLWTVGIEARLIVLQVIQHDALVARAERQQLRTITAPAKRGEILDRRGRVLAFSVDADSIYAVPTEIRDPERVATLLCDTLQECDEDARAGLMKRLSGDRAFAYVRRQVSPRVAQRVAALALDGIGFLKEDRRFYPNRELAAHLLGYVGIDNQGLHGIEFTYDSEIRGRPGKILIQTDARRRAFSRLERPPTVGATLELSIDEYLQHIVERELRAAVERYGAAGGTIILLEPHTGEILALANEPTFNPNAFAQSTASDRRNRAIQDIYEPGSTFKIVTASAALQEQVIAPDDPVDVSAGMITFGSRRIDDAYRYGILSFTDVIVKSSNVGAIKVGLQVGPERLGQYARRFGFGQTLSRDFQGESKGIVWDPASLNDSALASMSIGYQVGVTPLQMVAAASAVANGGELVEPRVVRAVRVGGQRLAVPTRAIRRSIDARTAATMTTIMEGVVARGTARRAQIQGYTVAGKTGTSQKLVDGRYSESEYNASFVGFVPSRDPAFTALVVIDSPRGKEYGGGAVAAPVFKRVAEAALRHLGIAPTVHPPTPIVARAPAEPLPTFAVPSPRPTVLTSAVNLGLGQLLMPDLRGLSARQALRALGNLGVGAHFDGDGFVITQDPPPGAPIDRGSEVALRLQRRVSTSVSRERNP